MSTVRSKLNAKTKITASNPRTPRPSDRLNPKTVDPVSNRNMN